MSTVEKWSYDFIDIDLEFWEIEILEGFFFFFWGVEMILQYNI